MYLRRWRIHRGALGNRAKNFPNNRFSPINSGSYPLPHLGNPGSASVQDNRVSTFKNDNVLFAFESVPSYFVCIDVENWMFYMSVGL